MAASLRFLSHHSRLQPDARRSRPPWKLLPSSPSLFPPIIPSSRSLSLHLPPSGSSRVSASSSGKPRLNSASTFAEEMLRQLHRQMEMAIAQEDYVNAASTRDTINALLEQDPVLKLQTLINKAVEEERFEDAAEYRKQLEDMLPKCVSDPRCYSDTITHQGIRVEVRSIYISERSQPLRGQYFFAYRVRISNTCARPVQVLSRHWCITDANGRTEHVRLMHTMNFVLKGAESRYVMAPLNQTHIQTRNETATYSEPEYVAETEAATYSASLVDSSTHF